MKKHLITLLIIILVVALAVGAVLLRKQRMSAVEDLPVVGDIPWALHTIDLHEGRLTRGFPALAMLSGSTEITISSQLSGAIESMGPREGVVVHKGDVLARISVAELQQQRAGLEAQRQAALAERKRTHDELRRQKQLKTKGLTTQELVDAKRAAAIAARKQVANLDKQMAAMDVRIGYGTVYAPRDAVVAARLMEVGDVAQPGKPLYRLTVDSAARLRVSLPQQILEQVHAGTEVVLEHGSHMQEVKLSRIFPALDSHALGAAEADLAAMPFDLPSGARIPARVILQAMDHVLVIPHRAIVRMVAVKGGDADGTGQGFVFTIDRQSGKPRLRRVVVKILMDANHGLAVEGDIRAGDQIVVAHQSVLMQLRDGDAVMVPADEQDGAVATLAKPSAVEGNAP